MKKWIYILPLISLLIPLSMAQTPGEFTIARVHYAGGGDWYGNRTSLVNLLTQLRGRLKMNTAVEESVVIPSDTDIFNYPMLYMAGHGTVRFSESDVLRLREYFVRGGFLWADDDFGMDESFRREIAKVFPHSPMIEIPNDHPVYSIYFQFQNGLPKVHEHHGGPPHLFGIYLDDRLAVLYTFNTDISDGIESEGIHDDPPEIREEAMKMAINIVLMALSS